MNWKSIKDIAWFVFVFILAVNLIEHQGDTFIVELAGDLFGALALMFVAIERALRDEE